MKFDELNNEEIVFVYCLMKDGLDTFNSYIDKRGVDYIVDSPMGKVKLFKEFTQEELDGIVASDKYKLFSSVVSKYTPIVELIADAEPDLIDRVDKILQINQSENGNSSEEEDM